MDPQEEKSKFWPELFKLILISLLIVIPFRLLIAQPFIVDGASMDPTFHTGQYLIVDELSYRFKTPERGDVVVFKYPLNPRKSFIKRLIGFPSETVSIRDGVVTIVNEEYPDGLLLDEPYVKFTQEDSADYILGEGEYFVMGDNRAQSADSRAWGPITQEHVIGRPIIQAIPPALFPGKVDYLTEINE